MRGVVWKEPRRWTVALVGMAVLAGPVVLAQAPATAGGKPKPTTEVVAGTWGDRAADRRSLDGHGHHASELDPGSLFSVTTAIGARSVWTKKDDAGRAITGRGVTVAVLDSGVQAVSGLDAQGKLVQGPDLSLESNSVQALATDTFGHGTHMAGIIAAHDPVPVDDKTGAPRSDDPSAELGVAPDAQVLALKLATTDGSTDVSQVIAALDWVTQHRRDAGMNVRIVNLSFGTGSVQQYQIDPLAAAAENAWRAGLVVVVSGGNGGADAGALTNPAIDPYVIAVGASDPQGSAQGSTSPAVADFSSRGTAARHVDLVAPGRSIVSLRAPGSFVDVEHPEGRPVGDVSGRLFRGSGTSQAAAVVSGAAALLLQAYPTLTPDQVKGTLTSTADPLPRASVLDAGAGQVDVAAAVEAARKPRDRARTAVQTWPVATGLGSLDGARGGSYLVDPATGQALSGEVDVLGTPWDAVTWSRQSAAGTTWSAGVWNRARWSGDAWTSTGWARARWSDSAWSRARWSGASWTGEAWARARWSGAGWERARWSGDGWS